MTKNSKKSLSLILCLLMILSSLSPVFAATTTTDYDTHWAKGAIELSIKMGILKGYPDGSFKPDNAITRAEFFALVNNSLGLTAESTVTYTDVSDGAWYAKVMAKANAAGYISGYPDGGIHPNGHITRQEAASIISRIKNLTAQSDTLTYADASTVSDWSKQSVIAVLEAKIMSGYPDNTFRASATLTRAEAVVILQSNMTREESTVLPSVPVEVTVYDKAGTYGSSTETVTIEGNVVIKAAGITLQKTIIKGNLTIAKEVGNGDATLKSVEVKGATTINGGGINSIYLIDVKIGKVYVQKDDGPVRIVGSGITVVGELVAGSDVELKEINLIGPGFEKIAVEKSAAGGIDITLTGVKCDSIDIRGEGVTLSVDAESTIGTLTVDAQNTAIKGAVGIGSGSSTHTHAEIVSEIEEFEYETFDNGTVVRIIGYSGSGGNITLPSTLGGLPVKAIGDQAFKRCASIISVTIPDSVMSIGETAFGYCISLESVTIPDSVTSIGTGAFAGCSSLKSVIIPDGVTSIENYMFAECISLKSVVIPDGVTSIGVYGFYGCSSLKSVTIPDSVTSIGVYTFCDCTALTSVTVGTGVTSIENYTFAGCTSLRSVTIPDNVTSIGHTVFYDCTALVSLTVGAGVTNIAHYAFEGSDSFITAYATGGAGTYVYDYWIWTKLIPEVIDLNVINGDFMPVNGKISCSTIIETAQYTGTVTWSPADETFVANQVYEATIVLSPKTGYTLSGVAMNQFTVAGVSGIATNAPDSGVIVATFPATDADIVINLNAISGVTVPANGDTPVSAITETAQYTGTVTWLPADGTFVENQVYEATITLSPKAGYTLSGVVINQFTVAGVTGMATNAADSGVITATFP